MSQDLRKPAEAGSDEHRDAGSSEKESIFCSLIMVYIYIHAYIYIYTHIYILTHPYACTCIHSIIGIGQQYIYIIYTHTH